MPADRTNSANVSDESTRQRIIAKAGEIFAQHGYGGTSMRDVAEAAAVSKASIFHHFKTKDALYGAVLDSFSLDNFQRVIKDAPPSGESVEDRIAYIVSKHLEVLIQSPAHTKLLLLEAISESENEKQRDDSPDAVITELMAAIREFQKAGQIGKDIDIKLLVSLMMGVNVFMFLFRNSIPAFRQSDVTSRRDAYGRMIARILVRGSAP